MSAAAAVPTELSHPWLFVVGCGRSGTTLLASMLDSHPDVAVPAETGWIVPLLCTQRLRATTRASSPSGPAAFAEDFVAEVAQYERYSALGLPEDALRDELAARNVVSVEEAIRTAFSLFAHTRGKSRYAEKTPDHVLDIDLLAARFPEAVFLHLIRDGRDVALSTLDAPWGPTTIEEAALYWRRRIETGRSQGRALRDGRYAELLYEDLVARPAASLRHVMAMIGLDYSELMLDHADAAARQMSAAPDPSPDRSLLRPVTAGLRDWRRDMEPADEAVFERLAGDTLRACGYPLEHSRPSRAGGNGRLLPVTRARFVDTRARAGHRWRRSFPRAGTGATVVAPGGGTTEPGATAPHPGVSAAGRRTAQDGEAHRRLASGSFWSGLAFGLNTVVGLASTILLVRFMTSGQYGVLAGAIALVSLLSVVSGFGLLQSVAQVVPAHAATAPEASGAEGIAASLRLARICVAAGGAIVVLGIAVALATGSLHHVGAPAVFVMLPIVVMSPVNAACSGILRATFRPVWLNIASVASSIVQLVTVLALILVAHLGRAGDGAIPAWTRSSVTVGATRTIAYATGMGIVAVVAWRWWRSRAVPSEDRRLRRRLLSVSLAMLLSAGFAVVVTQLDVLILGIVAGSSANALYQPVSRLAAAVTTIPIVIGVFFLPLIADLASRKATATVRSIYHWSARWNLVLCAPALGAMLACPTAVSAVLFGHSAEVVAVPTRVLGLAAAIHVGLGLNGLTLDAFGRIWYVTRRVVISLIASTIACCVLVPAFGMTGAAFATLVGLATSNLLCSSELWARYRIAPWNRAGLVTALCFAGAVATAWMLDEAVIHGAVARCLVTAGLTGLVTLAASTATSGWREWRWFFTPARSEVASS